MNEQDRLFFSALYEDRADSAKTLEKPSMRGVKKSVSDKYSDQAHFIYELLQNADDTGATRAKFILEQGQLIFVHNGTRHFSVSDPAKEDSDLKSGTLGDINAITSVANSNKTEASIGKFGVGFKAVFQYTSTPHIYDPDFRFKIERFIVPVELDGDFPARRHDETLFVFPFDHPERTAEQAYEDIAEKLRHLTYPLLFMSSLKEIEFEIGDVIGLYSKRICETCSFGNITAQQICLTQNDGDELYDENLWLFSRSDDCRRSYSVGFLLDNDGRLRPVNETAFCFFPTKENTGLNFVIHAPFLLTDSREGILAGESYNVSMVRLLADLAAKAIVCLKGIGERHSLCLIDDSIFDIIPYDSNKFSRPDDKSRISFLPFYESIKRVFTEERILPSTDGYTSSENAYWAAVPQLAQLFSNKQLSLICNNSDAHWAFISLGRDEIMRSNKPLVAYIDSLVRTYLNEDAIISGRLRDFIYVNGSRQCLEMIRGIDEKFIESQTIEWLNLFYKWLSETKNRRKSILKRPVFLDQNCKAAAAFDENGQHILFLPVDNADGYRVVNPELLNNPVTSGFIEDIGIKSPSLRDRIYNKIIPLYNSSVGIDTSPHFKLFFEYYCQCPNEDVDDFIELIRPLKFLRYNTEADKKVYRGEASGMYLPTPELKVYFETKPDTPFILLDEYKSIAGEDKRKSLFSFLNELGIKKELSIEKVSVDPSRSDIPHPNSKRKVTWEEGTIDGCKELAKHIASYKDREKSVLLWNSLLSVIKLKSQSRSSRFYSLSTLLKGICYFFYRTPKCECFVSSDELCLKQEAWLVNRDGEFIDTGNVTIAYLAEEYDVSSDEARELVAFLGISNTEESTQKNDDNSNLTDSQRQKIQFAEKIEALGIDESYFEELKQMVRQREASRILVGQSGSEEQENHNSYYDFIDDYNDTADDSKKHGSFKPQRRLNKTTSAVVRDIAELTKENPSAIPDMTDMDEQSDSDEYMPHAVNYSRRIERAKQKSAAEIDRIAYYEDLQARASAMPRYSFGWFRALLEMESLSSGEKSSGSREISISFGKVEREAGSRRTLVLKYPSRYIPQFMEDLTDIPLVLHIGEVRKTAAIEVANISSYTLRVKLKNADDIDGVDLSQVNSASIDAKSPAFLLEELSRQFSALDYPDDFDMQANLCENIEFIFGPPGTGKTTHLAKNVLLPLMKGGDKCRVLVLTPTNKAADVLTRRIMDASGEDHSYEDWLIRFGATGDEMLEESPVFADKTFDIRERHRNITITTIARFAYDFFMPQGTRIFLNGINWDYIVIDEASMIPLANIIYPLYKKTPRKFIIAGDPFQIKPITSVDMWKNDNIYTMVHLDSFTQPETIPHQYKVDLLTTQYRSTPEIGEIFSRFAYGGILKHYRASESRRALDIEGISSLNIIKYPVSKYESIYRAKRLQHSSSYQVYSALFTYEYICRLAKSIAATHPASLFRIGVISPYRAQADLIDKLLASDELPNEVEVQTGTIHGFQGDECDIIFAVFNTPPSITDSAEMFLNKINIINVSISRARDYLFIIMPDDNTENIGDLRLVKRVEQLVKESGDWSEYLAPDLEKIMFGQTNYLESNTFSTSHQSVNVYVSPERCYEVRTEDNAVDIQIHRNPKLKGSEQSFSCRFKASLHN